MGDILQSMGEARALHHKTHQPVLIVGRDGRPVEDHGLFRGVPYLLKRPAGAFSYQRLMNGVGVRPYIAAKTTERWTWKPYKPRPAEIVFTPDELEFAERYRGHVLIEPNVKSIGHNNKAWGGPRRWAELNRMINDAGFSTVQCVPGGGKPIAGTALTPTFRYAAAVLSVSRAAVLPEGGLHHAAAAVGTPAVVLFGGFISPEVTGYEAHTNIFTGAGLGCGMRTNCAHCRQAMAAITPSMVLDKLKEIVR